jgi:hypothetical protein
MTTIQQPQTHYMYEIKLFFYLLDQKNKKQNYKTIVMRGKLDDGSKILSKVNDSENSNNKLLLYI